MGYSDCNISILCLCLENFNILIICFEIYKKEDKNKEIKVVCCKVLDLIKNRVVFSFINGKVFIENLKIKKLNFLGDGIVWVIYEEKLNDFVNFIDVIFDKLVVKLGLKLGLNLRDVYVELIEKVLISDNIFVFLIGNLGIGKIIVIVNFLKFYLEEGFFFFYISFWI